MSEPNKPDTPNEADPVEAAIVPLVDPPIPDFDPESRLIAEELIANLSPEERMNPDIPKLLDELGRRLRERGKVDQSTPGQ